jgi:uncharacterized membrane protein
MGGIVRVGEVVVGVSGEGLEVEFAGCGNDACGDFASGGSDVNYDFSPWRLVSMGVCITC